MTNEKFEPVIGLEIHVELKTKSKMFCGCDASYFGHEPNTHCCPVCLGLPGALPVPNKKAIEWCVMMGMALNCEIPLFSKFDRKNYFYPDLAKGYQISQYDKPFAVNGFLDIKSGNTSKRIRIRRVHMEEDTGKLTHATVEGQRCTLVDFNRCGVPLVEIVTEPDITDSEDAKIFLKKLHQIIRYLGISDADMEKGSMRLEPNISVREVKSHQDTSDGGRQVRSTRHDSSEVEEIELPPYKVEVKNINSFNFVKKAIDYEIVRHIEILKEGQLPKQETRGWDEKKGATYSQRSKEEAHDYRYFPEPDIPPIRWIDSQISELKSRIGELPEQKIERFTKEYGLSEYDAIILTDTPESAMYFEESVKTQTADIKYKDIKIKTIANWIINKKADIKNTSSAALLKLIASQTQKTTIPDEEVLKAVTAVINENSKVAADYKSGKQGAIMYLVGGVMKYLKGQADPTSIRKILEKELE